MKVGSRILLIAALATCATASLANSLVAPGEHTAIAQSTIGTSVSGEWNKLSRSDGPNVEIWTRDGDGLNKVSFFGGIAAGNPIYKEKDSKNAPLPKVAANMLLPDIPVLFESTYRAQFKVDRMSIDSQDVVTVNGRQAIKFAYTYVKGEDEVDRKGEAIGAIANGKLYLVAYEAPAIYFFDKDHEEFQHMVGNLKF